MLAVILLVAMLGYAPWSHDAVHEVAAKFEIVGPAHFVKNITPNRANQTPEGDELIADVANGNFMRSVLVGIADCECVALASWNTGDSGVFERKRRQWLIASAVMNGKSDNECWPRSLNPTSVVYSECNFDIVVNRTAPCDALTLGVYCAAPNFYCRLGQQALDLEAFEFGLSACFGVTSRDVSLRGLLLSGFGRLAGFLGGTHGEERSGASGQQRQESYDRGDDGGNALPFSEVGRLFVRLCGFPLLTGFVLLVSFAAICASAIFAGWVLVEKDFFDALTIGVYGAVLLVAWIMVVIEYTNTCGVIP